LSSVKDMFERLEILVLINPPAQIYKVGQNATYIEERLLI